MSTEHVCRPRGYLGSGTHNKSCVSRPVAAVVSDTLLSCVHRQHFGLRELPSALRPASFHQKEIMLLFFFFFNLLDTRNSQDIIFTGVRFGEHVKSEK